jgi:hypothetical protein
MKVSGSFTRVETFPADGVRKPSRFQLKVSHGVLYRTRETLKPSASPTVKNERKKSGSVSKILENSLIVNSLPPTKGERYEG